MGTNQKRPLEEVTKGLFLISAVAAHGAEPTCRTVAAIAAHGTEPARRFVTAAAKQTSERAACSQSWELI